MELLWNTQWLQVRVNVHTQYDREVIRSCVVMNKTLSLSTAVQTENCENDQVIKKGG